MKKMSSFADYIIHDVFSSFENITSKSMFGGYSLYKNGVIFGMIIEDKLYFKTGESNLQDFKEVNSQPFSYQNKKRGIVKTSYWEVPEEIYANKDELGIWLNKSLNESLKAKNN